MHINNLIKSQFGLLQKCCLLQLLIQVPDSPYINLYGVFNHEYKLHTGLKKIQLSQEIESDIRTSGLNSSF